MTSNENGCLYGQSQIDQKGKMNWLTSYLVRLVDHVGHNFIVYLCPNWSTKNSPIRTKHKSLYVLFGYIVVDHVGKVIFIQSCAFWSTLHTPIRPFCNHRYLVILVNQGTNKDDFCKCIIVLVGHHWLNRGRQLQKYLNQSIRLISE